MAIYLGEDIRINVTFKDLDGNKVDPVSSSISIYDPSDTEEINDASLTKSSTGVYYYQFDIPSTGSTGVWTAFVQAEPDSLTAKEEKKFYVRSPKE